MLLNEFLKVLIVDDERRNLKILTDLLRKEADVFVAKDGEQGLEKANKILPDLVLLDIVMPGMDGFEVLRLLKQSEITAHIPVIFITGLSAADEEKRGLTLGAQDYIYKPFCPEVVKARVATHLQIVQQAKHLQQAMLQEKMASLGTLTAGVAHEINNPANFSHVGVSNLESDLLSFQDFLFNLVAENADKEIVDSFRQKFKPLFEHIETIKDGTYRIKSIIKDLWAITQPDSSEKIAINIADCIQSTLNLVRTNFSDGATFSLEFGELPTFYGYPTKLSQAFMNVFVNACEAIELKRQNNPSEILGLVEIECQCSVTAIEILVRDNGCGMNETTQQKIFEPFYTTKEVGSGTGLGMAISFAIIEEHGGTVEVKSTLGESSTIILRLPITKVKAKGS